MPRGTLHGGGLSWKASGRRRQTVSSKAQGGRSGLKGGGGPHGAPQPLASGQMRCDTCFSFLTGQGGCGKQLGGRMGCARPIPSGCEKGVSPLLQHRAHGPRHSCPGGSGAHKQALPDSCLPACSATRQTQVTPNLEPRGVVTPGAEDVLGNDLFVVPFCFSCIVSVSVSGYAPGRMDNVSFQLPEALSSISEASRAGNLAPRTCWLVDLQETAP